MTDVIRLTVPGRPQPRGSKVAIVLYDPITDLRGRPVRDRNGKKKMVPRLDKWGRVILHAKDDNPKSKPWMNKISRAARLAMCGRPPVEGPVDLTIRFYLKRPQAHFRSGKFAGQLFDRHVGARPIVKPDRGKLARAVEDALTGIFYVDDSQIVGGPAEKHFCRSAADERVEIEMAILPIEVKQAQRKLLETT